MKKSLAILITAVLLLSVLSGCSGGATPSQSTSPAEGQSGGAPPSPGGDSGDRQFVVGTPTIPGTLDSHMSSSIWDSKGGFCQVYDYLFTKDEAGNNIPMLVDTYEKKEDGTEYTITLKQGVRFWNGEELKAEDIKYTVERAKAKAGGESNTVADIDTVEVVDDYTFKFHMAIPNRNMESWLTCLEILNAKFTEEAGDSYGTAAEFVMGTGPYVIKAWDYGSSITYEANADYFQGAPAIKNIYLKSITDADAAVVALQTGEIQLYIQNIPYIQRDAVKANSSLNMVEFSSYYYNYIIMNQRDGRFVDLKMRQAVAYAIDRADMALVACESPDNVTFVNMPSGPDFVGMPASYDHWPYEKDLEKARELVREAGHEGSSIVIKTTINDPYPKISQVLQDALIAIGLQAEVVVQEQNGYVNDVCINADFEIAPCFNVVHAKDCDILLTQLLSTSRQGPAGNYQYYQSEALDALLAQAKIAGSLEERQALYEQVAKIVADDVAQIPLYYPVDCRAYSTDLEIAPGFVEYDKFMYYSWK